MRTLFAAYAKVRTGRGVRGYGAKLPSCTFSIQMLFVGGLIFQTPAQNL